MENLSNAKRTNSSSFPLEAALLAKKKIVPLPTSGDVQSHLKKVFFQSPTVNPDGGIPKFDIESQASGFQEWR